MLRLALILVFLLPMSAAHADITGKPRIIDGDTLHINQTKIRLHGIDAPEMKQTCRTSKGKEQMCGVLSISFFVYSDRLCWLAMDIEHPPRFAIKGAKRHQVVANWLLQRTKGLAISR